MAINSKLKQASNQETNTETNPEEKTPPAKWFSGPVKRISGAGNGHLINTVVAGIVELWNWGKKAVG